MKLYDLSAAQLSRSRGSYNKHYADHAKLPRIMSEKESLTKSCFGFAIFNTKKQIHLSKSLMSNLEMRDWGNEARKVDFAKHHDSSPDSGGNNFTCVTYALNKLKGEL